MMNGILLMKTDDSTWIGEFDLRATYGVGFVESLPDIAMVR